ncbi:hypothetical protein ScPMuIL_008004 [Solemya velum]
MSANTLRLENRSKVLPADKTGLPWEIWRIVLSYLSAEDLCKSSCVCKTWNDLVLSLDSTRWRELYLHRRDWKHPFWPINTDTEPLSWKKAFRDHYFFTRFWTRTFREPDTATCLYVFKRKKDRKVIRVGSGMEHESLKSALSVANDFDKIVVYPGIYDEQFEMSSKIPLELVGEGELGSVILVVCIEQIALTGRVSNLVFRAPWFTNFILKVRSGYLQVDNCILEDGMTYVQNPGTCHFKFCTFRHATIVLQHVNSSIVENCEFYQADSAAITVEGNPKSEKNWTYPYMEHQVSSICRKSAVTLETSNKSQSNLKDLKKLTDSSSSDRNSAAKTSDNELISSGETRNVQNSETAASALANVPIVEKKQTVELYVESCSKIIDVDSEQQPNDSGGGNELGQGDNSRDNSGAEEMEAEGAARDSQLSMHSGIDDEDDFRFDMPSLNSSGLDDSSSSDDSPILSDSDDDFSTSSSEESVIMLSYPERHQPRSISASAVSPDVQSICSSNTVSQQIKIIPDHAMRKMLGEVRGCLIRHCCMSGSKGGLMASLQAQAIITDCEVSSVGYGIRCIQNSKVIILKNEIHHCKTSGVFMRLSASGLLAGNDIHSNCEAGVDIRKNADPIVQCNRIHHGKRSGIVVLGSGRGQIKHNDIYQNKEAGIYILYRGNPTVSKNHIYNGRAAGIAVNEGGRGYIFDNAITGNQWGGVDVRHGGEPVVRGNMVCNGQSDGIVIGERGRGFIENNTITGNAGSGVWVMGACNPLIHGNQINENGDTGIAFVDTTDMPFHTDSSEFDSGDLESARSLRFWRMMSGVEDENHPPRKCSQATVEYNSVFHNNGKGISLKYGDELIVQCNAVHGNKSDGIQISQKHLVLIKSNSVTSNGGNGIIISKQGKVDIYGNGIYDNRDHGIFCQNETAILENDIVGNQRNGIHLSNNTHVTVKQNRIQSLSECAVMLISVARGLLEGNQMFGSAMATIHSGPDSRCSIENNHIVPSLAQVASDKDDVAKTKISWVLKDPPARPNIQAPPALPAAPAQHVSSVTKVTIPTNKVCEQGSKLCCLL